MAKSDLKNAFKILPILPSQRCLLVMKDKHPIIQQYMYFVEKNLPFGASVSCHRFQLFSACMVNYLDNYMFVNTSQEMCNQMVRTFLKMCDF